MGGFLGGGGGIKKVLSPQTPQFNIQLFFRASWVGIAPAQATACVVGVCSLFNQLVKPRFNVTVAIGVGWGECNGSAVTGSTIGESLYQLDSYSYAQMKNALIANAISPDGISAVQSLPNTDPNSSGDPFNIWLCQAQERVLGLFQGGPGTAGNPDGWIGFNTAPGGGWDFGGGPTISGIDFCGTVVHEISEVLGRFIQAGDTGQLPGPAVMDYFRFTGAGTRFFGAHSTSTYISSDNGTTNLKNCFTGSPGDYGDWQGNQGVDSCDANATSNVAQPFSSQDQKILSVIGYPTNGPITWNTSGL